MIINNKKYNLMDSIVTDELKPAFNNNNIPIAFASDNNYVKYLSVAIISLTDNMSKDYNYDIVILEDKIKDKSKLLLLEQVKDFKNVSLRFIDINRFFDKNNDVKFYVSGNYSRSVYNRLFIPNIFNKYDKVLYLDVDILINDNLVDLYNTDLNSNFLIAAIQDLSNELWLPNNINQKYEVCNYIKQDLKIKDPKEYINAGVILFNIKECLNNDFLNSCLKTLNNIGNPIFLDQDIINITCNGKIKYLDYRYNFLAIYLQNPNTEKYIFKHTLKNIKIFHFAEYHPWDKNLQSESIDKWIKVSSRSLFFK